jgi:hypothetical protein
MPYVFIGPHVNKFHHKCNYSRNIELFRFWVMRVLKDGLHVSKKTQPGINCVFYTLFIRISCVTSLSRVPGYGIRSGGLEDRGGAVSDGIPGWTGMPRQMGSL